MIYGEQGTIKPMKMVKPDALNRHFYFFCSVPGTLKKYSNEKNQVLGTISCTTCYSFTTSIQFHLRQPL